ncbi:MAG: cupin domain-containing protein [Clostridia bacterium]|nr:cupin domain-containing protein [Clostridia bacterium]MDD4048280.1 cupin domain-containing protein [Clostridia bacterium]
MLRKADEMIKEIREQMRGGKGHVEVNHIFKKDELHGKAARLIAKLVLNPGCSIGIHPHENDEEIFYVLKGKGLVDDNGSSFEVSVGDATLTGGGETHSIESTGDEPLEVIAVILYS